MSDTNPSDPMARTQPSELEAVRSALAPAYEVLAELGRGGMAVVYHARDPELDRDVALKVLPRSSLVDEGFVQRFQREGRIAARLEHRHIVPVYGVGRQGDVIYIAMKFLRGGSLATVLERRGRLAPAEVWRILQEVGEALDCAAVHGVVHRDIKPENILFDDEGHCIVTDFGIAKSAAEGQLTNGGQAIGTPHYMSPEQARGEPLDIRSDLYSLGVVGYRCLTGRVPYDAPDNMGVLYAHVTAPIPTPTLETPEHREVYRLIERLLQKEPSARPQSGKALMRVEAESQSNPASAKTVATAAVAAAPPSRRANRTVTPPAARFSIRRLLGQRRYLAAAAVAAISVILLGSYGVRSARLGRSTCPPADSQSPAGIQLLMDPVAEQEAGSDLDVYYDVCGLVPDTPFRVELRLSRRDGLLGKVLGGGKPVVATAQERADGPATRRSQSLDLDDVRPGNYTLELAVIDNRGRERRRSQTVTITD